MVALNLLDTCFIRNTDRGQKIKKGPWAEQKDTSMEQNGVNCGEGEDGKVEEGTGKDK